MNRFARTFERLRARGECGLFPYVMAGFPDIATSHALADAALDAGADGFEIAVPFSDPLADGTTMQRVNARALAAGAGLDTALELVSSIRRRAPETPIALMSYYNPLRQRGDAAIASDLASVGADGVIVPDVPAEEAADLHAALGPHGLGLAPLIAPTSTAERIRAARRVPQSGARRDLIATGGGLRHLTARARPTGCPAPRRRRHRRQRAGGPDRDGS